MEEFFLEFFGTPTFNIYKRGIGWILTTKDFIFGPIYFFVMVAAAHWYKEMKYSPKSILKRYFVPALVIRLIGAILTALVYEYVYGFGDTYLYYNCANQYWYAVTHNPEFFLEMLLKGHPENYSDFFQSHLTQRMIYDHDGTNFLVRILGFTTLIAFNSYMAMSFILTFFAFVGCWKLYKVFYDLYPSLHREFAISILFIPSVWFWGTGVMKDSVAMGGLGLFTYYVYKIFLKREIDFKNVVLLIISFYISYSIKEYIVYAFIPALLIWIIFNYRSNLKNIKLKAAFTPVFFLSIISLFVVGFQVLESTGGKYRPSHVIKQAVITKDYIYSKSGERLNLREGSGYNLGDIEPTIQGVIAYLPKCINVTLFRPYPFEISKPQHLPSAIESLLTLLLTLYVIGKVGIFSSISLTIRHPVIFFCFTFSLFFAFMVGLVSGNFGALARYKIPLLPFYFSGLFLLIHHKKNLIKTGKFQI